MKRLIPIMSGHLFGRGVTIVVAVVDHKTSLACMLKAADLPQQLGTLARKHGSVDEFNGAGVHGGDI